MTEFHDLSGLSLLNSKAIIIHFGYEAPKEPGFYLLKDTTGMCVMEVYRDEDGVLYCDDKSECEDDELLVEDINGEWSRKIIFIEE